MATTGSLPIPPLGAIPITASIGLLGNDLRVRAWGLSLLDGFGSTVVAQYADTPGRARAFWLRLHRLHGLMAATSNFGGAAFD